jgi:putative spermidine/putrescine transport system ATP-binding protein
VAIARADRHRAAADPHGRAAVEPRREAPHRDARRDPRIHRELDRATIYVTHDQDEALSLADRIVVMKDGVVQQIARRRGVRAAREPARRALHGLSQRACARRAGEQDGDASRSGTRHRADRRAKQPLPGKRAAVAIRPEEIVVGAANGENTIAGRVDNVEYGGRDSLLDIVTPSGTRAARARARDDRRGDDVRLHVPVERTLVYPAE